MTSVNGHLETAKASRRSKLERIIANACSNKNGTKQSDGISIDRPSGRPLAWLVRPPALTARTMSLGYPSVMIMFRVPEIIVGSVTGTLARLYSFSQRQAQIVELLVAGFPLPQVAEILEITHDTAKLLLKRIFEKLEVRSQNEFIRFISSGPLI